MLYQEKVYRLKGLTPILGTQPANERVYADYLASKAPNAAKAKQEALAIAAREAEEGEPPALTVFLRDINAEGTPLCVSDYVIRGFFKSAGKALSKQLGVTMMTSKIDKYLFALPRMIHIKRYNGERVYKADGRLERPLRTNVRGVEQTALACSEYVGEEGEETPWVMDISLLLIENENTKTSAPLDWEAVEEMLDYGRLCGLGQWRNGGYGRFEWECLGEGKELRPRRDRK